ncbi:MAG: hypothetical protein J6S76_03160 [Clostridia bacterium]|nr:hypothetical protein [Clostridia bacterium]
MIRTVHFHGFCSIRRGGILACLALLLAFLCVMGVAARTETTSDGVLAMTAEINEKNPGEVRITVTPDEAFLRAKKGETLYLFTLQPHEDAVDLNTKSPTATKAVDKTITYTVSADGSGERYRAQYVLALGTGGSYRIVGRVYVGNPQVLAENHTKRPETPSIKGLVVSGALAADAKSLGISHAVIPISVDRYLTSAAGDPRYSCSTAGKTNHFDPTMIAQLDALVSSLRQADTRILFRFILDGSDRGTTEPTAVLYAEDAPENASGWGFSIETKEAYQTLNNVFTYFSERYAAQGAPIDFIVGYQVNEWVNWYSLGYSADMLEEQVHSYAAVFRLADLALRSHSAYSRVYVPLSNLWATAKPFLRAFAEEMGEDAAWSVAVAPYASNALDDSIWDDSQATDSDRTTYLTMKNISILRDFLEENLYRYRGARRAVIIDDFAVHGTSGDAASQERQTASFIYAYYQAVKADFIDAMIWHRINDGVGEQCSLGLRQLDGSPKPIYALFRAIDTQRGSALAAPYAQIVGERKWTQIIRGFRAKDAEVTLLYDSPSKVGDAAGIPENTVLWIDFLNRDLRGFAPTDFMASAEIVSATEGTEINSVILSAISHPMTAGNRASLTASVGTASLPKTAKTLYLAVKASVQAAPSQDGSATLLPTPPERVQLQLQLFRDGKKEVRTIGEAVLDAGAWTTVAFDIKDFCREADGADLLCLTVSGDSTDGDAFVYTLSVNELRYENGTGLVVLRVFLIILAALGILVLIFAVLVIRARAIRRRKRRMRAAAQARRRQAQLVQMRQAQSQQTQSLQNVQRPASRSASAAQEAVRKSARRSPDLYSDSSRYDQSRRK